MGCVILEPWQTRNEGRVELWRIVAAILYRLKSRCQWSILPSEKFFTSEKRLTPAGVSHHFRKWVNNGCFKQVWIALLRNNHKSLDLSSVQLDGSQTPAKNGGEPIGYQWRKSGQTTNALFLRDNQRMPHAMATPQCGNHHDVHDIQQLFEELCQLLKEANVDLRGVFMNADSGFLAESFGDAQVLREQCIKEQIEANIEVNERNTKSTQPNQYEYFDDQLYKRRFVIERMNAWIDSFKALLICFENTIKAWMALHFLAFTVLLCRKITNC